MTTLIELDSRVTRLEETVRRDLSVRVDAMNWAIGQTYKNTEVTRLDVTGLRVDLTHLETSVRGDIAKLTTDLDLRTSELRHDLGDAEVSIRHDMGTFRNSVMQRFDAMDQRFDAMDKRFDNMDKRFDELLAAIQRGNRGTSAAG
jgi:hypothetical protein